MALIKLKGTPSPLYITNEEGRPLKEMFDNKTLPEVVNAGSFSFKREALQMVVIEDENKTSEREKNKEHYARMNDEYKQAHKLPPEVKAERLGRFELFYWALTKSKDIPEEILQKAKEIQRKFFIENPKRLYCDLALFKPIMEGIGRDLDQWQRAGLDIVIRTEEEDKRFVSGLGI